MVVADGEFLRYLERIEHVRTLMRILLALVFLLPIVAAAEKVRSTFRFTPAASGPIKQSATIRIGAPSFAE